MSDPKAGTEAAEVTQQNHEAAEVEALPAERPEPAPDPHDLGLELPESRDEAVAMLLEEVEKAREEANSYLDDLKRVAADFDNYRKRSIRDQASTLDRAAERVVRNLLPVLDTFDAALGTEPKTDSERQLYSGMLSTRQQLLSALQAEGLEVIPTIDEPFDPEVHEPAGAPGGGDGELVVSGELRRGYRLSGKVVRPALVSLDVRE
ncbi:MAG: nucleotide exchange factor GrpE [Actinobacteria bacterium]|nr:nucleotide exchange factor GrpE [Actinomycetota bacterium]